MHCLFQKRKYLKKIVSKIVNNIKINDLLKKFFHCNTPQRILKRWKKIIIIVLQIHQSGDTNTNIIVSFLSKAEPKICKIYFLGVTPLRLKFFIYFMNSFIWTITNFLQPFVLFTSKIVYPFFP